MVGPPLGGLLIGAFGPVATTLLNAVSYLLSALGIGMIGGGEAEPARSEATRPRTAELLDGWRYILAHPSLRGLFFNTILVNGLIMATAPLLAVLMLGQLGFPPWQYGLAFAAPCLGGLLGSRLSPRVATRFGQQRVLSVAGSLRACWSLGLAFVVPGLPGLALVIAVQFGLVASVGIFSPVLATYRLQQTDDRLVARVLAAWSIGSSATIAILTALWGLLASTTSPRVAIAAAGALLLATPLLLPGRPRPFARTARVGSQAKLYRAPR